LISCHWEEGRRKKEDGRRKMEDGRTNREDAKDTKKEIRRKRALGTIIRNYY
jgi:hypothetical protein